MTDQCPYAKSDMTPCVLKDGPICFVMNSREEPICAGCERWYKTIGVERPVDWDKQVAEYRAKGRQA